MVKQSLAHALPVLLTRPEAQARRFADALAERFGARLTPVISPLMAARLLRTALPPGDFVAVLFTSETGVSAATALQASLPLRAYCVGRQTARVAKAAGFQTLSADGDASALIDLVKADRPRGRLLHLRGQDTTGAVAERLTNAGFPTVEIVIYRQDPQPLTAAALALMRRAGPVLVPLFSPRSAELLAGALPDDTKASLYLAALSPVVGETVTFPHAALITARRPDADAMLQALANLIVAASPP